MCFRKSIIISLFVTFFFSVKAQITITNSDMPNVNDTVRISVKQLLPGFNQNLTGANYTWNYNFLIPDSQRVEKFVSPASTGYPFVGFISTYGRTNYNPDLLPFALLGTPPTNVYDFYKKEASKLSITVQGVTTAGTALPILLSPADVIYKFPLQYGNIDSSNSGYANAVPGIGYFAKKQKRVNTVDGWGTLITPHGTFNTLRVKSVITVTDSIYFDSLGFGANVPLPTVYEFKWLAQGRKIPVLEIDAVGTLVGSGITVTDVLFQDSLWVDMSVTISSSNTCPNASEGSAQVVVTGGRPPYVYAWSNGQITKSINNLSAGTYNVTVTEKYGKTAFATVTIGTDACQDSALAVTVITSGTCVNTKQGSAEAFVTGGRMPYTYFWSGGATTTSINNLDAGLYNITVTDKYSRTAVAIASVETKEDIACLNIPNGFTPDGDGVNDYWNIRALNEFTNCKVEIFNQWGSILFSSTGYTTPWDGKYNNQPVEAGTYYYVIDLNNGYDKYNGSVTIIK